MMPIQPSSAEPVCELAGVTKIFRAGLRGRTVRALDTVSFALPAAQITCLLGPNGGGKSTSIRILLGLSRPDAGTVRVFGHPPSPDSRRRIGYLPEAPWFPGHLTAMETLRLSGHLYGMSGTTIDQRATELFSRLRFQPDAVHRPLRTYSKGMLQKIALCQALLHQPDLIILDEPTAGLDPVVSAEITGMIQDLRTTGTAILLCSHDLEQVEKIGETYVVLREGRVYEQGGVGDGRAPRKAFERIIADSQPQNGNNAV